MKSTGHLLHTRRSTPGSGRKTAPYAPTDPPAPPRKEGEMEATARVSEVERPQVSFIVTTSTGPDIKTAEELIEAIDMLDCFNPWQDLDEDEGRWEKIWYYSGSEWRECEYHGPWHDSVDPLSIRIVDAQTSAVIAEGRGTDH